MKFLSLNILKEHYNYSYKVFVITKFLYFTKKDLSIIKKICLNTGFKQVLFNKYKIIHFLMLFELLSNQKACFTFSKKNFLQLGIEKGFLSGCKVTLRKDSLFNFLHQLLIAYFTKIMNFSLSPYNLNFFTFFIYDFSHFYTTKFKIDQETNKANLQLNFIWNSCAFEEKQFLIYWNKLYVGV